MKLPDKVFGISTAEAYKRFLERPDKPKPDTSQHGNIKRRYEVMDKTNTYALGVEAVRILATANPQHNGIYRPLTFKENIEARVNDYNTEKNPDGSERSEEERLRFFKTLLDSCTGIAYKKKSTKFKIIPVCNELITINRDFNEAYLPIDYDALSGIELDRGTGKYRQLLTKDEVLSHEAWKEVVGDVNLLKAYTKIVFDVKKANELMGFYTRSKTDNDELRELYVGDLDSSSNAGGDSSLSSLARFLRVAHE